MSWSRSAAEALETGRWDGPMSRALASAFAPIAARALVRPAVVPAEVAVVCVGGATIGGSGKTRVAIACARELAAMGARVALVGHAYRAAPRSSRIVANDDVLADVGDEALVCARALAGTGVPVVVGPTRQAAIDHAVGPLPEVVVLDGPLAIRSFRGASRGPAHGMLSLLAVDGGRPWGSGRLPPSGDLRASREDLLARAHYVVPVDALPARVRWQNGETAPLGALRALTDERRALALFTAIARPDRLVRALSAAGLRPRHVVSVADHGAPVGGRASSFVARRATTALGNRLAVHEVAAWIATAKCALHLEGVALGAPLGILEAELELPSAVVRALDGLRPWGRRATSRP